MVDTYSYRTSHYSSQFTSSNSNHPSFSSTLLDAIYRSIDRGEDEIVIYKEAMRMKQNSYSSDGASANVRGGCKSEEDMANFKRACMIEKWMEKKASENVVVRRKSATDSQIKKSRKDRENSSSSSSDSTGSFSSSEAESLPVQRLKPVRTGPDNEKHHKNRDFEYNRRDQSEQKSSFLKTKSRALKIYGDLKKVKQPISPGGKVAAFLNSLFTGGNVKKPKINSNDDVSPSLKSGATSTCSSASSFSRSCLSKTPSSRGKSSTGPKRSVRFSPVSMIIDEDYQKSSEAKQNSNFDLRKNDHNRNSIRSVIDQEVMFHVTEKNRRVEEAARDLLRNYQKKIQSENEIVLDHLSKSHVKNQVFGRGFGEEDEDDDDDVASCASSDLFELDNLSAIGMERYTEELPVYETTHLRTNRAIANGLVL
ncbi:hypothetical protein BUALT_Bualt07G0162100 [Buddleja alternifolia]|uniref:Protein BIG GRAIN 1-like B n=1 Tax=Buddleja alternifolia TaxID=168488 RepID=A0AAV6XFJ4_9LAMI|nr:hypothetical protein BUALT_Bualt07G0162100 [Buddleja alternifolia]